MSLVGMSYRIAEKFQLRIAYALTASVSRGWLMVCCLKYLLSNLLCWSLWHTVPACRHSMDNMCVDRCQQHLNQCMVSIALSCAPTRYCSLLGGLRSVVCRCHWLAEKMTWQWHPPHRRTHLQRRTHLHRQQKAHKHLAFPCFQ